VTTNATYIASFVPTTGPLASMQTVVIKSSNSSLGIVNVNIMSPSLASQSGNNLVVPKGTSVTPVGNTLKFVYNETEIAKAWITETGGTFKTWNASSYAVNHDGIEFTALFEEKAFDWEGFFQKNVTYLVGGILAVIIAMLIITRI
jgi:hypothetical protein